MLNETVLQMDTGVDEGHDSAPWYKRERWLVVCIASVIPVVAAIYAPQTWKIPLATVGGLLMTASVVMAIRRQLAGSDRDDAEQNMSKGSRRQAR